MPFTSIRPTYIYGPLNYNPLEEWFFERLDQVSLSLLATDVVLYLLLQCCHLLLIICFFGALFVQLFCWLIQSLRCMH
jgi:hypothetical protein